ncbi:MAG TPA: oligoendopeptidase F [Syntrophomonas sp.]|nr:oligoendopeptidase F [Syntrophomonas sp.]
MYQITKNIKGGKNVAQNVNRKREDIDEQYKWKLEDIYSSDALIEEDFKRVKDLLPQEQDIKSTLGKSAAHLKKALQWVEELERKAEKLYVYSRMRRDEDNGDSNYQAMFDRMEGLNIQVGSATSFMVPEIIAIPDNDIKSFMEDADLKLYQFYIEEVLRQKEHILSAAEERLLAMSADISIAPGNVFTMLNNADIKFPVIKNEKGEEVELTKGRYGSFMESSERRVRQDAFKGLYSSYSKLKNTLGATLGASIKKDVFYARARQYPSALEASLDQDNVPVEVYNRLIESVHANLGHMYRYMDLRKRMLKVDELHMYDIYTPLVQEFKMEMPYKKACELVLKGLSPLGQDYLALLEKGMKSGWIDVYENEGKTSGAYSWGSYDTHPYVLLNHDDKLDDVFTIAHEMGHALHTYYSDQAQPFIYSQYAIFVAEVASTVNESLLMDYLLKHSQSREEKMYLINHYLEEFRGTVYRQTMFAEFEKIIHEQTEKGQALTSQAFSSIYRDLNRLYYGENVVLDEEIDMEWARIPHFYSAFYVYKYATGFSAATALKQQILQEGQPAVSRYLNFLTTGGSDYPINLLQGAGVDLTTPQPVDDALDFFGHLVDEMEKLAN